MVGEGPQKPPEGGKVGEAGGATARQRGDGWFALALAARAMLARLLLVAEDSGRGGRGARH